MRSVSAAFLSLLALAASADDHLWRSTDGLEWKPRDVDRWHWSFGPIAGDPGDPEALLLLGGHAEAGPNLPAFTDLGPSRHKEARPEAIGPKDLKRGICWGIDPAAPKRLWIGAERGEIWRSSDAGKTWNVVKIGDACLVSNAAGAKVAGRVERIVLRGASAVALGRAQDEIFAALSTDGGAAWSALPKGSWTDAEVLGAAVLLVDATGRIVRSTDGGKTVVEVLKGDVALPFDPRSRVFHPSPDGKELVAARPGVSRTSVDGGKTWSEWDGPDKDGTLAGLVWTGKGRVALIRYATEAKLFVRDSTGWERVLTPAIPVELVGGAGRSCWIRTR